jgi:hypothetical protein
MALEFILSMLRLRFKLEDDQEFELLRAHFTPDATTIIDLDSSENPWEDVTNASLSYLLKNLTQVSGGVGGGAGKREPTSAATQGTSTS